MKLNTLALAIVILVLLCGGIIATVVFDIGKPKVDISTLPVTSVENTVITSQSDNTTGETKSVMNFNTPYKPAEI